MSSSRKSAQWSTNGIHISHNILELPSAKTFASEDSSDLVRLHFGLRGKYDFSCSQLNREFSLRGSHNNILYTQGLDLDVHCRSAIIETFGVNYTPAAFLAIAQGGNDLLKRFCENILAKKNCILSTSWKINSLRIQYAIKDVIQSGISENLRDIFLTAKCAELLVLVAEKHGADQDLATNRMPRRDRTQILEAKDILTARFRDPPSIRELAKLVGLNDYKLKKGFYALFETTIFGYILEQRMRLAARLLIDSEKLIQEISAEVGYSTPQHFSYAFKNRFGVSPRDVRKNPDRVSF